MEVKYQVCSLNFLKKKKKKKKHTHTHTLSHGQVILLGSIK